MDLSPQIECSSIVYEPPLACDTALPGTLKYTPNQAPEYASTAFAAFTDPYAVSLPPQRKPDR